MKPFPILLPTVLIAGIYAAPALPPAAPVTLRYKFTSGRTVSYSIRDSVVTKVRQENQPEKTLSVQKTTSTLVKRVISVSGGLAVIEETPTDGITEVQAEQGNSTQMVPPVSRLYTLTALGKLVKLERKVPPGIKDTGAQFLDGLNLVLSEKAVAPGATWTGTTTPRGLDEKPLTIRYTSRYVGASLKAGRRCHQIVTTFSAPLTLTPPGASAITGTLDGKITSYLADDLGMEVQQSADLKLTLNDTAPEGKFVRTLQYNAEQILKK